MVNTRPTAMRALTRWGWVITSSRSARSRSSNNLPIWLYNRSFMFSGSAVVGLLFWRCPAAVRFGVPKIVLPPVERHTGWLFAHLGAEIDELQPPWVIDPYAASAVPLVARAPWIIASFDHSSPRLPSRRFALSVDRRLSDQLPRRTQPQDRWPEFRLVSRAGCLLPQSHWHRTR